MAIELNSPRIFRAEYDHLEQAADSVKALTVDPFKNIFYYFFPGLGAWLNSHQELRSDDPVQSQHISKEAVDAAKAQVERILSKAGMEREVVLYGSHNYSCSSYGGYCSITAPIISVPFSYLTALPESIFEPKEKAKRLDIKAIIADLNSKKSPRSEESKEQEVAVQIDNEEVPFSTVKSDDSEAVKMENKGIPKAVAQAATDPYRFTTNESLFMIAREVANLKSNNPFIRLVSKVIFVAALSFVTLLPLPLALGSVFMAAAVAFHVMAERTLRSHLDVDAVKLLEEYFLEFEFFEKDDPSKKVTDPEQKKMMAQTCAYEAGKSAIEKLILKNTERRKINDLCRLYITVEGNNLIDLINPFLTARLNLLEEYRENEQNPQ